ncbi:MAG: glycosyltransferase [Ignavibacteriaceae bacterium]|nr:glycosyltransferase [Ignavibacteriaceae bacterium]
MITLSMIVKNEEKYLAACLESVKDVVDEIVLVDTGSTDRTIEIAKKYSAKIFHFEWSNDFAAARNFALEHSSCDWILYLDADECLSKKSVHEIKRLTRNKKREAYKCIINNIDEINFRPSVMTYVRLFPNDRDIRFEGKVHEQIETSLRKNNFTIKNSAIEIDHYGYNLSKEDLQKKANRNLAILLKQFEESRSSYYAFHLGQTYAVLLEKENAEKYFAVALQDVKLENEYKALAYRYIAINYAKRQNYTAAFDLINKSLQCDNEQPLALFAAANIYLKLGDASIAGKFSRKAFEVNRKYLKGEKTSNQNILIDELHLCYYGLEISLHADDKELFNFFYREYSLLKKTSGAGEWELFDKLLNNKPIAMDKLSEYVKLISASNFDFVLALLDHFKDILVKLEMLQLIKERFSSNSGFLNKLGILLMETQKYSEAVDAFEQSIKTNGEDPSTIFYLVSAYLQNGESDKIPNLVFDAEKKYANQEQVLSRLNLLKEKLPQIFL